MLSQGVVRFVFVLSAAAAVQAADIASQVRKDSCPRGRCLAALLDGLRGSYQLLPGVNISSSAVAVRSTTASEAFAAYLKSLTLHIALYNEPMVSLFGGVHNDPRTVMAVGNLFSKSVGTAARQFGLRFWERHNYTAHVFDSHIIVWTDFGTTGLESTGRARKPSIYSSRFRFLSLYTVFAVAFVLLSALVGKAVTLSVIALVIAGIAAVRGAFGFGANSPPAAPPIFDVVRRPHVQVTHTQSAEEVYEAPGTSAGGVSFVYPIRGRAVPTEDTYSHITVEAEGRSALRHKHMT